MGTIVNAIAIIGGSLLGIVFKRFLKESLQVSVMLAMGLCVLVIGINGALETKNILLVISCIAIGTIIGETLDIDGKIAAFSLSIEKKYFKEEALFAQGFMLATCLYSIGAMAILGSIQSGLGNHQVLYAKSALDAVASVFLASIYGIGVMFSVFPVVIYQGIISLAAGSLVEIMSPEFIAELTAVGSIMIIAIGLNMLNVTKIKVANLLPALLVLPLISGLILPWFNIIIK